jgi:hypothetical protein
MLKALCALLAIALAGGCERATKEVPVECREQAAELRRFLLALADPAQPVAPPSWTTGDAEFDSRLERRRAEVREAMKPVSPGEAAARLTQGIQVGMLEEELSRCPAAHDQLLLMSVSDPGGRRAKLVAIADEILACECSVAPARVKPLLYVMQRGPD